MSAQKKSSQKAKKKAVKKRKRKARAEETVEEVQEKSGTKTAVSKSKKVKKPTEKPEKKKAAEELKAESPEEKKAAEKLEVKKPAEKPAAKKAEEKPEAETPPEEPKTKKTAEETKAETPSEKPPTVKQTAEKKKSHPVTTAEITSKTPPRVAELLQRIRERRAKEAPAPAKELVAGISVERLDKPEGTAVLKLGGFLQRREATELLRTIEDLQKEGVKYVLFDMSGVQYANSSAIGAFVNCASKLKAAGGNAALVAMRQNILNVFRTLGLAGLFVIAGSKEKALLAIT